VAGTFAVICGLLGALANGITMAVILKDKKIKSHCTTPAIFFLSLSDFVFCTISLPSQAVRYFTRGWPFGEDSWTCKFYPLVIFSNIALSVFILCLIAVNRAAVLYDFRMGKRWFTWKRTAIMVVLLWIFAALFMIPNLTGTWGETGFEESTFSCTVLNQPEKERGINPLRVIMTIGISLPLIVIGASYSILLKRLKEALQTGITSPTNESLHDKEIQVTKTILLVCVFFVLLFIPTALIIILDPLPPPDKDDYKHAKPMLHVIGYIINWCSAIVNPFIYVFTNQSYMASFKKTVKFNTLFTTWTPKGGNKRPKQQVVPADSPDVETPIIKNQFRNVKDHQQNKDTEETPV